jgi:DNA-directed RNA polymerase subunit RPC12/RpoP
MALCALRCPNCNGDINIDDSKEFAYCPYCGTKIQMNETIEVKHSGSVKVEGIENLIGAATNEQIERRVALLFDYIDGLHSCNFNETANSVLNTKDDYRVYLAYILKDYPDTDDIYYKKFYKLAEGISEFEKGIAKRFTADYFLAFLNDPARVKYLLDSSSLCVDANNEGSPLDESIFFTVLKHHAYRTEEYLLSIGVDPLTRHSFGTINKPASYYRMNDEASRKYGYSIKYSSAGTAVKVKPGLISYYDYVRECNDKTAVDIMQPYVDRLNAEAKQRQDEAAAKKKSDKERTASERRARRKEAGNAAFGIISAVFIGIAAAFAKAGRSIASLFKKDKNIKPQQPDGPEKEQIIQAPAAEQESAAVPAESIKPENTEIKQKKHRSAKEIVRLIFDVIRWILLLPCVISAIVAPILVQSTVSAVMGVILTFFECPANRKLDGRFHMTRKIKVIIVIICVIIYFACFKVNGPKVK